MPGLIFYFNKVKNENKKVLKRISFPENFCFNEVFTDDEFFFGNIKYESYPFKIFSDNKYIISFEGHIYNKTDEKKLQQEFIEIADLVFDESVDYKEKLQSWLKDSDGDFVLSVFRKSDKKMFFLNDILGRLPVYFFKSKNEFILTRDFSQISNLIPEISTDKMALAQTLLFGYPLGKRTLFDNVFCLKPATLMVFNPNEFVLNFENINELNFENKKNIEQSQKEASEKLHQYFIEATKNRAGISKNNLLSLSGGLDSRAVLSAFDNLKIPLKCATYSDADNLNKKDVEVAKQLADIYNSELEIVELQKSKGKDVLELLQIKMGMNYLGMSFILPFFKKINKNNLTCFTGDGGDKALPDLRPDKNISGINDLIKYIISQNKIFSLNDVEKILNIDKKEILTELRNILQSYPEKDLKQKYVHFLIFERTMKWLFEGEDRNRYYFRSVSPFYSYKFFDYAMNCPDEMKKDYKLFRLFLERLSPEMAAVNNANWDIPVTSEKIKSFFLKNKIRKLIPQKIKQNIKSGFKKKNYLLDSDNAAVECFSQQFKDYNHLNSVFNIDKLKKIKYLSEDKFYYLFTLTSVIEKVKTGKSSIGGFVDRIFV